jgi:hypothetical protein
MFGFGFQYIGKKFSKQCPVALIAFICTGFLEAEQLKKALKKKKNVFSLFVIDR